MRFHDGKMAIVELAATLPQVSNQLFATIELRACRLIAIEIADQTNAERDVVEIIAVHMAAIDLTPPPVAHFDLTVPGRSSVSNYEMIGQTVLHVTNVAMVIIECPRVALPRAAVVHNDDLPARIATISRRAIDFRADRGREITKASSAPRRITAEKARPQTLWLLVPVFLDC